MEATDRIAVDMAVANLVSEISNIEHLARQLDKDDQYILRDCKIRIDKLIPLKQSGSSKFK